MATRICKVKRASGKLEIEYEVPSKDGANEFVLKSRELPRGEMIRAFEALVQPAIVDVLELPDAYTEDCKATGASFSYVPGPTGKEIMGCVITLQKKLSTANSPLILNTPHLPSEAYSGNPNDTNPTLPGELVDRLEKLQEEARLYIRGERAQATLPGV